jgi:hypothetical protein
MSATASDPTAAAPSRGRRSKAAGVLGILAVIAILLASVVAVVHSVVLSPDALTAAIVPVGQNPEVQTAVADKAAAKITTALGIEDKASKVLGDRLGPLVAPSISRQVEDRLASAIEGALASPAFAQRWEQIVHASATVTVNVLKGDSTAITTSDGVIYLNVLPAISQIFDELKAQGLIDASVQLPDLSNPSTPAETLIAQLAAAIGASLPPDFGQVPIAQTAALEQAQAYVSAFDSVTVLLDIVALALVAAAVWLAADRRAMLVRIGVGAAIAVAVVPPLLRFAEHAISTQVAAQDMAVVVGAFVDAVVEAVSWPLRAVAAVSLGVAIVGMLAGPHGVRAMVQRPVAALPLLLGALAFVVVWVAIGPDLALIVLALVTAWIDIWGRPLAAPAPAPAPA